MENSAGGVIENTVTGRQRTDENVRFLRTAKKKRCSGPEEWIEAAESVESCAANRKARTDPDVFVRQWRPSLLKSLLGRE